MAWVKVPTATTAVACSVCVAAAMALPAADTAADRLAKTLSPGVYMSALDISTWDALSALPLYQALLTGNTADQLKALGGLDSVSGIPAYLEYLQTRNLEAFRTTDTHPGLAALNALPLYEDLFSSDPDVRTAAFESLDSVSAIPSYAAIATGTPKQKLAALGNLDSTSAIPEYVAIATGTPKQKLAALGNLDSTSAIPAFVEFAQTHNTDAFVPEDDGSGGYAALSGLSSYRDHDLSGIDAFSALTPHTTTTSATTFGKQSSPEVTPEVASTESTPAVTPSGPIKKLVEAVKDSGNLGKAEPTTKAGVSPILFGSGTGSQDGTLGQQIKKLVDKVTGGGADGTSGTG